MSAEQDIAALVRSLRVCQLGEAADALERLAGEVAEARETCAHHLLARAEAETERDRMCDLVEDQAKKLLAAQMILRRVMEHFGNQPGYSQIVLDVSAALDQPEGALKPQP